MMQRRAFGSTYRLQLNGVGFAAAAGMVPFLHDLGVQTLYVSPITRARAGSSHGYDVVDPTVLDPALGTPADYAALLDALGAHEMSLLIDIVPNHMAATSENPYFADVLRHGRASQFASYFDIDWAEQSGKVMLAVLGDPVDDVIAAEELRTIPDEPGLGPALGYFDHRFPLDPDTFDLALPVAELLDRQHYRLAAWRLANRELNYRRFFDINELIGVRQEDSAVFEATHRLIRELVADPRVAGVRVDHVDGLRDPAGYLERLRAALPSEDGDPVIEVEKILEHDEPLPAWAVDGTTGYEFAAAVTGLFVDSDGAQRITDAQTAATGDPRTFAERAVQAKRDVLATLFEHQRDTVASRIAAIIGREAGPAIAELTAQLAVYRTYRRPGEPITAEDLRRIETAAQLARSHSSALEHLLDDVVALFIGEIEQGTPAADAVAAWQQLTSPATAKGVEDTALYNSGGLLAAADVGADPDHASVAAAEFHARMRARQDRTPRAQSTLSTHDSKRSHDVRCRLAVLSEIPNAWDTAVAALDDAVLAVTRDAIDAGERRYIYEALVGVWPLDGGVTERFCARVDEHVVKSAREAKRHSSWTAPDTEYEARIQGFVRELLTEESETRRRIIGGVVAMVERAGATNSLASVVVRAVAPGVPDVYQGDDAWLFALVDPDNRAPFDVAAHRALLRRLPLDAAAQPSDAQVAELLDNWRDGRIKQLVTAASLRLRRRLAEFFTTATYEAVDVTGRYAEAILGFVRRDADRTIVCVVPVRPYAVGSDAFPVGTDRWGDTVVRLPRDVTSYTDVITGERIAVPAAGLTAGELLRRLPVCLLES